MTAGTAAAGGVAPRRAVPLVVPAAVAVAWAAAVVAAVTGKAGILDHDALFEEGPAWAALALFVVAWQAMVTAMAPSASVSLTAGTASAAAGR